MRQIVVEPRGGLANRLIVLHSTIELARDWNADVIRIRWVNNEECGCDFTDIFDGIAYEYTVNNICQTQSRYTELVRQHHYFGLLKKVYERITYKLFWKIHEKSSLDVSHNIVSKEERTAYLKSIKTSTVYARTHRDYYGRYDCEGVFFSRGLLDSIDKFKCIYPYYIAMHIRRTDNVTAISKSPTDLFFDKVQELVRSDALVKIYLATDDENIFKEMVAKYPDNIILKNVEVSRGSKKGMQDAALEFLLLANAKKLYGSFYSSYSSVAHIYGKNEFELVVN